MRTAVATVALLACAIPAFFLLTFLELFTGLRLKPMEDER